jgi:16S rRNA (uracil1498-N3)-methyltransferase
MRVPRVCVETPIAGRRELWLTGSAANHLQRVLRLRTGDALTVFDGHGGEHAATVQAFERGTVHLALGEARAVEHESPLAITLWQAPCRGDRMDYVVEKATELGVRRIVPWEAERAVVRLEGERAEQRRAHWQAIARSACEQCGRNCIPAVELPQALPDLIARCPGNALKLALDRDAGTRIGQLSGVRPDEVVIAIGPEGGLTPEEAAMLAHARFLALSLGPRTLRADTAGAACIAALQALWGDG